MAAPPPPPSAPIRALDRTTIDQIAAGEVVDRPSSVVKELVENALDSGAGHVDVCVEQGGLAAITVVDDGCGMAAEDAQLALQRHATSKIASVADLLAVGTYGFRGEALSSIASISRFVLTTRRAQDAVGTRIEVDGGELVGQSAIGCPPGTSVRVRELFYNVPARRKFMRAGATEQALVQEVLLRTFLGARRGACTYTAGKRRLLDVSADCPAGQRAARLLGRRVRALHAFAAAADAGVTVTGELSPPALARSETCGLWAFVNGRFVRDRMLQRAVLEGYQLAFPDKFATALVYIDISPASVDVNVHPQKLEVRFEDAHTVFRAVRDAVAAAADKLRGAVAAPTSVLLPAAPGLPLSGDVGSPTPEPAGAASLASGEPAVAPSGRAGGAPSFSHEARVRTAAAAAFRAPSATAARMLTAAGRGSRGQAGGGSAAGLRTHCGSTSDRPSWALPAPAAAPQDLLLAPSAWDALRPLGFVPAGYLACAQGERMVLINLAAAYGLLLDRGLQASPQVLHRLLLPPQFRPDEDHLAWVDDFVLQGSEDASGGPSGLHLQPIAEGVYAVQAVPQCLAGCSPTLVAASYFDAAAEAGGSWPDAQTWQRALQKRGAFVPAAGSDKDLGPRLLSALASARPAIPMELPVAAVLTAAGEGLVLSD